MSGHLGEVGLNVVTDVDTVIVQDSEVVQP